MVVTRIVGYFPSLAAESAEARDKVMAEHLASIGKHDLANEAPTTAAQNQESRDG